MTIFEEMGFSYLGPVDGHDVQKLTFLLREAKAMGGPVLLHVITKKGKGYIPAEATPSKYHGVGRFNPVTGVGDSSGGKSFSETFGDTLLELARTDPRICAITAAMEQGTGLSTFAAQLKDRYFDVGIAEGHAVSMAAGLAKQGMLPVFAVYSTFLQRSYDMLQQDVGLLGLHVVLAVDRAGLVGEGRRDPSWRIRCGLPPADSRNDHLLPRSQAELRRMLTTALLQESGPVAVRYPRGGDGAYQAEFWEDRRWAQPALTIVTYGINVNDCLAAAEHLQQEGILADVIKLDRIAPLSLDAVRSSLEKSRHLLVVEEAAEAGCVGAELLAQLSRQGCCPQKARLLNLQSGIVPHGAVALLRHRTGLDEGGIIKQQRSLTAHEA